MDGRWIQKILQRRPSEKTQRSLRAQEDRGGDGDDASAFKSPGNPLSLGQVLANILYGPVWPANRTSTKCSEDMRIYNAFLQNFTLWATKVNHMIISKYSSGRLNVFYPNVYTPTVLDATAKGPEGLLDGNTFSFGNFDQCVSTKSKNLGISGGYSLVDIDYRPTYQVHPGFYHDDHLDDYEPLDDDESAWEAINEKLRVDTDLI